MAKGRKVKAGAAAQGGAARDGAQDGARGRAGLVARVAREEARPPGPAQPRQLKDYDVVALVLQGGGALGAYQGGVVEALEEAGIAPRWFAGVSIGAVNAALMAGSPRAERVGRLRAFWEGIARKGLAPPGGGPWGEDVRTWLNLAHAWTTMAAGLPGFFRPRPLNPWLAPPGGPGATSFYDAADLRAQLDRLVDWDLLNATDHRLSLGAVDVETGEAVVFDSAEGRIGPEHVLASGALPPAFAPVEVGGRPYWDGGIVSNTPLQHVLDHEGTRDSLVFAVDLFSAEGERPRDMGGVLDRHKDIGYASRTRANVEAFRRLHNLRLALRDALLRIPEGERTEADRAFLRERQDVAQVNVIRLTYRKRPWEGHAQDYEFSLASVREHWAAGLADARAALARPGWLDLPPEDEGVVVREPPPPS